MTEYVAMLMETSPDPDSQFALSSEDALRSLDTYDDVYKSYCFRVALDNPERSIPYWKKVLDDLSRDPKSEVERSDIAGCYAMAGLAFLKDTGSHELILRAAKIDKVFLNIMFDDLTTELFEEFFSLTYFGDPSFLKDFISDASAYEFARAAGVSAIGHLVCDGKLTREEVIEWLLQTIRDRRIAPYDDYIWLSLVYLLTDLAPNIAEPIIDDLRSFSSWVQEEIRDRDKKYLCDRSPESAFTHLKSERKRTEISEEQDVVEFFRGWIVDNPDIEPVEKRKKRNRMKRLRRKSKLIH